MQYWQKPNILRGAKIQKESKMNTQPLTAIIHKRDVWDKKMHLALSFQMNAALAKTQHKFPLLRGLKEAKRIVDGCTLTECHAP